MQPQAARQVEMAEQRAKRIRRRAGGAEHEVSDQEDVRADTHYTHSHEQKEWAVFSLVYNLRHLLLSLPLSFLS